MGFTHPVTLRDPERGPLRLCAFDSYSFRTREIAP